jgi:hypothetical protein
MRLAHLAPLYKEKKTEIKMQHTTPLECRNQFNGASDVLVMVVTTEGYG